MAATPKQRTTAYHLFMETDKSMASIAKKVGIPEATVKFWSTTGKWKQRKEDLMVEMMADVDQAMKEKIGNDRIDFLRRHLDICKLIEKRVFRELAKRKPDGSPGYIDSNDLLRFTRAFRESADRAARLLGLDVEKTKEADAQPLLSPGHGRLVLVGLCPEDAPVLPASKEQDVTDEITVSAPSSIRPF